jgi:chromosome segregation ATPase
MDVPVPETVLSALGGLRRELQGQLEALVQRRSELETEVQALGKEIESKQYALEVVEATERQLAGQRRGQPEYEGREPGASMQVWASAKKMHSTCGPPGLVSLL